MEFLPSSVHPKEIQEICLGARRVRSEHELKSSQIFAVCYKVSQTFNDTQIDTAALCFPFITFLILSASNQK